MKKITILCASALMLSGCASTDWGMIADAMAKGANTALQNNGSNVQNNSPYQIPKADNCPNGQIKNGYGHCVSTSYVPPTPSKSSPKTGSRTNECGQIERNRSRSEPGNGPGSVCM